MAIIYSSSFETEPSLAAIFDNQVGTTLSFDGTHVYSGSRALKVHQTGAASASIRNLPANPGRIFAYRFGFYIPAIPPSNTQNFVVIDNAVVNCVVSMTVAGVLRIQWPGGTAISGGIPALNTYHVVDMLVDTSGTTYTCQWKVDGVAMVNAVSPVQVGGADQVDYKISNSGANVFDMWMDMLVIANDGSVFPLPDPIIPSLPSLPNIPSSGTPHIPAIHHALT